MKILKLFLLLNIITILNIYSTDIYVPEDYSTIQEAVDNSSSGDTIYIAPGLYNENIEMDTVTPLSEYGITIAGTSESGVPSHTRIRGSLAVNITNSSGSGLVANIHIKDIHFNGSFLDEPYGISNNGEYLYIENCIFEQYQTAIDNQLSGKLLIVESKVLDSTYGIQSPYGSSQIIVTNTNFTNNYTAIELVGYGEYQFESISNNFNHNLTAISMNPYDLSDMYDIDIYTNLYGNIFRSNGVDLDTSTWGVEITNGGFNQFI